jgi:hypothetical protein
MVVAPCAPPGAYSSWRSPIERHWGIYFRYALCPRSGLFSIRRFNDPVVFWGFCPCLLFLSVLFVVLLWVLVALVGWFVLLSAPSPGWFWLLRSVPSPVLVALPVAGLPGWVALSWFGGLLPGGPFQSRFLPSFPWGASASLFLWFLATTKITRGLMAIA